MTVKKPFKIMTVDSLGLRSLDRDLDVIFSHKLESRWKRDESGVAGYIYQSMEHGNVYFSANGSPVTTRSFGFEEKQSEIIWVTAHVVGNQALRAVVDNVTNSGLTISVFSVTAGTAGLNISAITTQSVSVFYQVIGSNP